MKRGVIAAYVVSITGLWAFIVDLVVSAFVKGSYWSWTVPWIIAYGCAGFSVIGGTIEASISNPNSRERGMATASLAIGSLVFLGGTLSAIFLVPSMSMFW